MNKSKDTTASVLAHARRSMQLGKMKGLGGPAVAGAFMAVAFKEVYGCTETQAGDIANRCIRLAAELLALNFSEGENPGVFLEAATEADRVFKADLAQAIAERAR